MKRPTWVQMRRLGHRLRWFFDIRHHLGWQQQPRTASKADKWPPENTTAAIGGPEIRWLEPPSEEANLTAQLTALAPDADGEKLAELVARLTSRETSCLGGTSFPLATYLQATVGWQTPSTQWLHTVEANPRPSRLFLDAHIGETAKVEAPPSHLLIYGRVRS